MKKILLVIMCMILGMASYSQKNRAVISKSLQDIKVPYRAAVNDNDGPTQVYNPYVSTKSVLNATIIGNTFYDTQTNGCVSQRIYVTEEGKMGAVWTRGITSTSYPDRGTGYNFYDGTAWGASPASRIENIRTGWPSIDQWNGGGEIAVSHQAAGPLVLMKRTVAGTGSWSFSDVSSPAGAPNPFWPALITSGPNHEYIHILAMTQPAANGGAVWNGLDGALLYWRSGDGGATWDINGIQVPTMVAPDYIGFGADSYSWAKPKGDTIAFIYGDTWTDVFVMYSYDNGTTWNRMEVLGNQYKSTPTGTPVLPFYGSDGANSLAIDKNGVFHMTFGRMRASDDGTGRVWYPYTDGLVYWNNMMTPLKDSLDLDTLYNNGQLIAYVTANTAGDTIQSIPYYNANMSSYSGIIVDDITSSLYVVYSGVVVDNPSNGVNFRHIKGVGTGDYLWNSVPAWTDMVDFNSGIDDMYLEFVFPSLAKNTTQDQLHYVTQSSDVPGSNIIQTTVPVHDNNIIYNSINKSDIVLGVKEKDHSNARVSNYPNPFHGSTTISITVKEPVDATLQVTSVTGQVVRNADLGTLAKGVNQIVFSADDLATGIYLYSVKVNGIAHTGRMVVK